MFCRAAVVPSLVFSAGQEGSQSEPEKPAAPVTTKQETPDPVYATVIKGVSCQARAGFSARREYWDAIRNAFRVFLFKNWDEVLQRINPPPLPAFP
jgi:hypothetical protein